MMCTRLSGRPSIIMTCVHSCTTVLCPMSESGTHTVVTNKANASVFMVDILRQVAGAAAELSSPTIMLSMDKPMFRRTTQSLAKGNLTVVENGEP